MIDFDGTISPTHGFTVAPTFEVVSAIKKLFEFYRVGIYSCRFNMEICDRIDGDKVIQYLKRYDIPYDFIQYGKPLFAALIDDRAYNPDHIGWETIVEQLIPDPNKIDIIIR
jgi:hypothetical protein